jgi:hypothetical protein
MRQIVERIAPLLVVIGTSGDRNDHRDNMFILWIYLSIVWRRGVFHRKTWFYV